MATENLIVDIGAETSNADKILLLSETGSTSADFRAAYIDQLISQNDSSSKYKASKIKAIPVTQPISEYNEIHGDEEPSLSDMNLIITDAVFDILTLDNYIKNLTSKYSNFLYQSVKKMNLLQDKIMIEKQRLDDINMICSGYKELDNVLQITQDNVSGVFSYLESSKMFMMYGETSSVAMSVSQLEGNGYEGNTNAYTIDAEGQWIQEVRSSRENLVDSSSITVYEYSRLNSISGINERNIINNDSKNVIMSVELTSDEQFNAIKIDPDHEKIIVKGVYLLDKTDNPNKNYLDYPISLTPSNIYTSSNTNICNYINIPRSNHIRLIFESDYVNQSEYIAFKEVETIERVYTVEVPVEDSDNNDDEKEDTTVTWTTTCGSHPTVDDLEVQLNLTFETLEDRKKYLKVKQVELQQAQNNGNTDKVIDLTAEIKELNIVIAGLEEKLSRLESQLNAKKEDSISVTADIDTETDENTAEGATKKTKTVTTTKTETIEYMAVDINAERKNIGIKDICGYKQSYITANFQTKEIVSILNKKEITSIAVFANEYYPDFVGKDMTISYYLVVNGTSYEVVPINSNSGGVKLLAYRSFKYNNSSITYLSETIKTAYLKVSIQSNIEYASPQIYNLKVCVG